MRKPTANAIGGKDVSPRQEPDALRFGREIGTFPALAQTYTKNHQRPDTEAVFGESVAEVADSCREERSEERKEADASDTVSPCPPAEDLKDFLSSKKTFKSGEGKAGSIDNIGKADTLPTEGFYD